MDKPGDVLGEDLGQGEVTGEWPRGGVIVGLAMPSRFDPAVQDSGFAMPTRWTGTGGLSLAVTLPSDGQVCTG